MNIREYLKVITLSHGIVPEFVNPKYKVGSASGFERSPAPRRSICSPRAWSR